MLAELELPHVVAGSAHEFYLHPSVLDSALQAAVGLPLALARMSNDPNPRPSMPFALESLSIWGPTPPRAW